MLYRLTREDLIKAIIKIANRKGLELKKVYSLSSGLYVTAQLTNGHLINFNDYEIREVL